MQPPSAASVQLGMAAALVHAVRVWPALARPATGALAAAALLPLLTDPRRAALLAARAAGPAARLGAAAAAVWAACSLAWWALCAAAGGAGATLRAIAARSPAAAPAPARYSAVLALAVLALRVMRGCWLHPTADAALTQLYWAMRERVSGGEAARAAGFPLGADDISAPWLTKVLQGRFPGIKVKSVRMEPVGADMGNASTFYRLYCSYAAGSPEGPATMMIKLPKRDLTNRVMFAATQMYRSEAGFYAHIRSDFPLEGPETYAADYREQGANFYVLMSDLAGRFRFPKEVDGCTPQEGLAVVRALAKFHATFWQSPRLEPGGDLSWVISQQDPRLSLPGPFMKAGWKAFLRRLGGRVPLSIERSGLSIAPHAKAIQDWQGEQPWTLAHCDAHLENITFRESDGAVGLYDWQLMRRGKGMIDVAHFVGGSCDAERGHSDGALLEAYVAALRAEGVEYSLEQAWLDYKMSLAILFCWHVSAAIAIPFDTEAHLDYDALVLRLCDAVVRSDALTCALAVAAAPRGLAPPLTTPGPRDHAAAVGQRGELHRCVYTPPPPPGLKSTLKRAAALAMVSSKGGHHGQKQGVEGASPARLEGAHRVDWAAGTPAARYAFDSYYLSGFADPGTGSPSVALRCCHRGEGPGEIWCMVHVPGIGALRAAVHPGSDAHTQVSGGGITAAAGGGELRLEMVAPMAEWRARFTGTLVSADGAEHNASLCLTWTRAMDPFSFGAHISRPAIAAALAAEPWSRAFFNELRASHQEHYEQFGAVTGELTLDGKTHTVQCKGMRDRAWGLRDWAYFPRYTTHYFVARSEGLPDTFFNVTIVSLPTMTHMISGFVAPEGKAPAVPIDEMSGVLPQLGDDGVPPLSYSFGFSAGGEQYEFRAKVREGLTQGLDMGEGSMWVNFRWTDYEVARRGPRGALFIGAGASEFGYRYRNAQPFRPTDPTLRPTDH
eukprot:TRINITY_DN4698_c0_g2_i1.p1 TRINITY_DN4698_c0_g2~~TRINITY_DN4698_c0_g2_i1.p1  ORF type:complete len:978 (+),score=292.98 TRINITY_DN4698_c0_g2_i1:81-2936(+)